MRDRQGRILANSGDVLDVTLVAGEEAPLFLTVVDADTGGTGTAALTEEEAAEVVAELGEAMLELKDRRRR